MQFSDLKILDSVRIDKWLWAVRICKTRQVAMDLCKRQRVSVDGQFVKPSRDVREGQMVAVKRDGIQFQYRVLHCIDKRVGAKLADQCKEDITPEEEKIKLQQVYGGWTPRREKGEGRPTKKDRRAMDKFLGFENE